MGYRPLALGYGFNVGAGLVPALFVSSLETNSQQPKGTHKGCPYTLNLRSMYSMSISAVPSWPRCEVLMQRS